MLELRFTGTGAVIKTAVDNLPGIEMVQQLRIGQTILEQRNLCLKMVL